MMGLGSSFTTILAAIVLLASSSMHVVGTERVYIEDTDRFPGWKGELPRAELSGPSIGYGESGKEEWRGRVEQISWTPRAFLFRNFLSDEECDDLITGAAGRMKNSNVVDNETGKSKSSNVRTSTGTFYARGSTDVARRVERRIAHVSFLPIENGEGLQILHYQAGQEYKPHNDYFNDAYNALPEKGGQRVATVLMYLSTPEEGGETVFPKAETKSTGDQWSECAKEGLAVKATKGDALLFYGLKPNGDVDPTSMHGSCPTTKGEKWSATKWLHVGGYGASSLLSRASNGECLDTDDRCGEWAAVEECTKNSEYMHKYCHAACDLCSPDSSGSKAAQTA